MPPEETGLPPDIQSAIALIEDFVQAMEREADPATREHGFALLASVDCLHRLGIQRLLERVAASRDPVTRAVLDEPAVALLTELYTVEEEAAPATNGRVIPLTPVRAAPPPMPTGNVVPLAVLEASAQRPRLQWQTVASVEQIPLNGTLVVEHALGQVLLARLDGRVYAYRNLCAASAMPLAIAGQMTAVQDGVILCNWHGCRYDLHTGRRADRDDAPRLARVAVLVEEEMVRVGIRPAAEELANGAGGPA